MSSELSPPPPAAPAVLSNDLLYAIAEKMLCEKMTMDCTEVDLTRRNGFTEFMRCNQITASVFFAQFVKMKKIEFHWERTKEPTIKLYRSKEKGTNTDGVGREFYGPYIVSKEFVGALIDYGKLRVKSVSADGYYSNEVEKASAKPKRMSVIQTICAVTQSIFKPFRAKVGSSVSTNDEPGHDDPILPAESKVEKVSDETKRCKSSIQSFCKLFLDKELSDEAASNIRFELDKLQICAQWGGRQRHTELQVPNFDEYLNLNAKEIVLEFDGAEFEKTFDCNLFNRTMQAGRVVKLSIECFAQYYKLDIQKTKTHWKSLFDFFLATCPNIQQISVEIGNGIAPPPARMCHFLAFEKFVSQFTEQLFPSLSTGSPSLRISANLTLCWRPVCVCGLENEPKIEDQKLYKMGDQVLDAVVNRSNLMDDRYGDAVPWARECTIIDQMGRQHKCRFQYVYKM